MTKKERIRLLTGVAFMAVIFFAVASIGWTKAEFIVVYNYGFDGKVETNIVKKGYVKEPPSTGRYGYTFDGWYYLDKQGNEVLFDFETEPVTRDLDLTAHWKPFETELYFNPNGGKCDVDYLLVPYGSEVTFPTPKRTGYYFVGWSGDGSWLATMNKTLEHPIEKAYYIACWSKFKPGTVYRLGEYEQTPIYDNEQIVGWEKERIEWIPVDKKDGKYLLVTRDIIDCRTLGTEPGNIHWSESELQRWLNEDFYNTAFTDAERELICEFTDSELGTTDRVTLLSIEESRLIFGLDKYVSGTEYAKSKGLEDPRNCMELGTYVFYRWFTRTWMNDKNWTAGGGLSSTSSISLEGVRPAIWVDAEKLN